MAKKAKPLSQAPQGCDQTLRHGVDVVLTDGTVQISSDGSEAKSFSILDGMGLVRLRRAEELQIPHLIQGHSNKLEALQELARQLGLPAAAICYMGDDDIDAPGIGIVPQQAMPSAPQAAA